MSDARKAILAALRQEPTTHVPPLPEVMTSAGGPTVPLDDRIRTLTEILAKLGAPVDVAADMTAVSTRIREVLAEHGATSLALSDAPLVQDAAKELPDSIEQFAHDADREQLLRSNAGLSTAQCAIAETGTLVLVAKDERHRLATLLPDLHIALVPASRLVATLGDGFAQLASDGTSPDSPTITFVTGPSRTADIELELVVGVHGPKALHVVIVMDA